MLKHIPANEVGKCGAVYGMRCRCPRCHPASNSEVLKKHSSQRMQPSHIKKILESSSTKEFEQVPTAKAKIPPKAPEKDISSKTISQQLPSDLSPALPTAATVRPEPTSKQLQRSRDPLNSGKHLISDSDEELVHEPPEFFDEEADDNDQKWMERRLRGLLLMR